MILAIIIMTVVLLLAMMVITMIGAAVVNKGRENKPPFDLVIQSNKTYIRKMSGQLIKIADHAYTKDDMNQFFAVATRAKQEHEKESSEMAKQALINNAKANKEKVKAILKESENVQKI